MVFDSAKYLNDKENNDSILKRQKKDQILKYFYGQNNIFKSNRDKRQFPCIREHK